MSVETIQVQGELLFELRSRQDWINKVPGILPKRKIQGEVWLWVDINGNSFHRGEDFTFADKHNTFPCKVYRIQTLTDKHK